MVEIAEIRNEETFRAWLDQEDLPREATVALAYRAAMRVLPVWWDEVDGADWAINAGFSVLPAIHCCLIASTGVLGARLDTAIISGAFRVADAASDAGAYRAACAGAASAYSAKENVAKAAAFAAEVFVDTPGFDVPWDAIRDESYSISDVQRLMAFRLWHWDAPPVEVAWTSLRAKYPPDGDHPWAFWIDWYQRALDGTEVRWDLLRQIALIDNDIWEAGPEAVAAEIARLQEADRTALSRAYPVDFTFDSLLRVMRMVGIDDDTAHLRDPAVVQAFLDDCEELRDKLQDFADYASDLGGGGNFASVLKRASDKVLAELRRTQDQTHLRARRIVELCGELELFSKEERARADLGETLSKVLDNSISLLRTVTRKHFGPSYTALAPLADLSLDHVDQDEVIALFDDMIARMEALPSDDLVALNEDGLSVFRDMLREVKEFRAAIAEASTDAFRALLEDRFAESLGSTGLALGRFIETSTEAAGKAGAGADWTNKQFKRVKSLADIVEAIRSFFESGGMSG